MNNNNNPFLSKAQAKSSHSQGDNSQKQVNQNHFHEQKYQPNRQNGSRQYFERPTRMHLKPFNYFPSGLYLTSMIFCAFFFIIWLLTFLITGGYSIDLLVTKAQSGNGLVSPLYVIAIASGVIFLLNLWLLLIWVIRFKKNCISDFNFVMSIVLCIFTGNIFLLFFGIIFCVTARARKKQSVQANPSNNVKNFKKSNN